MKPIRLVGIVLIAALLAACAPSAQSVQTAIAETQTANHSTLAAQPTRTPPPTKTRLPTLTPQLARSTPRPTPIPTGKYCAWNYPASQDSGGLQIEIARVVILDKSLISTDLSALDIFDDRPVLAEIFFKVTNTTEKTASVYPDPGKVLAGTEQIELLDFAFAGTEFGDKFSGDILSGATVIGGIIIGLKHTGVEDVKTMKVAIDRPFGESLNPLGPPYEIDLDLSVCKRDPLPDELK